MEEARNAEYALKLLKKAIKIYAPSWEEEEIVCLLESIFEKTNTIINRDEIGNFIATIGNGKPVIFLCSHMDTIADPLEFKDDEGFFFGRGAVDCRAPLIAMALACKRLASQNFKGKIVFAGLVAEEVSTKGIEKFLDDFHFLPNFAIFGEPTTIQKICIGYKGRIWLNAAASTKPSHVSAIWGHANVIEALIEFVSKISENITYLTKGKKLTPFHTPRVTITTFHSGRITNMLPDKAITDIDIRLPPGFKVNTILKLIENAKSEIIKKYKEIDEEFEFVVEVKSKVDAIRVPTRGKLCKVLGDAIEHITGAAPRFVKKTGTTFMNHIGERYECQIVTYGPGNPQLEHSLDEKISKKEFLKAIDILERLLLNLLA